MRARSSYTYHLTIAFLVLAADIRCRAVVGEAHYFRPAEIRLSLVHSFGPLIVIVREEDTTPHKTHGLQPTLCPLDAVKSSSGGRVVPTLP